MAVVNVSPEAHAVAKAAAERAGMSLSAWASDALTMRASYKPEEVLSTPMSTSAAIRFLDEWVSDEMCSRLAAMALERSQTPSETLSAALDALVAPRGVVVPQRVPAVLADGMAPCRCDGPEESGPHHRTGCERRT